MLETIRQYALDRLRDAKELFDARQRHALWFADWAGEVDRALHGFEFDPTHDAVPDVLAALEWAYDSAPALAYRLSRGLGWVRGHLGHLGDFRRQYEWVAARDGQEDPAGWAAAVAGLALGVDVRPGSSELSGIDRPGRTLTGSRRSLQFPIARHHARHLAGVPRR